MVLDHTGNRVAPLSLECLTRARGLPAGWRASPGATGGTWEAGYGASGLHTVVALGGGRPGPAMAAAIAAQIAVGNTPDAILIPHNHDGRDIAARLSVKIDRPVLTNVIGLEDLTGWC